MKKSLTFVIIGLVVSLALCVPADKAEAQKKKFISIGTAGTGGTYYILGAGIAKVINKYVPDMKGTVQGTAGAIENCKLLGAKRLTLAFSGPGEAYWAYKGERMFKERYEGLRWLMGGYSQEQAILTRADSSIKSIADLRGKRVGVGAPGSGAAGTAIATLEANGLKQGTDYKPEWLSYVEVVEGLKDGTIDAGFITTATPSASITDLATSRNIRLLPLSRESLLKLKDFFFFPGTIKAGTYKGVNEDIPCASNLTILITHKDVDDESIFSILKAVHEHTKELAEIHPVGKDFTLENGLRGMSIPLHPAAEKYYRERGVLK